MRECVVGAVQEVRAEELQPGASRREGEPHRPVLLARRQRPRRDHDQLVGVRGVRGVHLGAADDDPVVAPIDDPEVEVRSSCADGVLARSPLTSVLRDREREVAVTAVLVVGGDAVVGVGAVRDPMGAKSASVPISLIRTTCVRPRTRRLLDQRRAGAEILGDRGRA